MASDSGHTQSLIEALKLTAIRKPLGGFTFIQMNGADEKYCYGDLFRDALSVCEKLLSQNFINEVGPKANIVILQMDVGKAFFAVWWGLVIAGYKPLVIAKPNKLARDNALAAKLYNVATSMGDIAVIADSAVVKETKAFLNHKIAVVSASECLPSAQDLPVEQNIEALQLRPVLSNEVAFLQLTSGSTGTPKAIQITHSGVMHHVRAVAQHNHYVDTDKTLNWLPFDHVVPLLTTHIKDVVLGIDQFQLPTQAVLADPILWIEALSKYQITHSWSPNFGFQKVVDALESEVPSPELDLSRLKYLMNAGEQVLPSTVRNFNDLLALYKLDKNVVQPAFGMAESCTCITYNNHNDIYLSVLPTEVPNTLSIQDKGKGQYKFVDLGDVIPGIEIRIADEHQQTVKEGVIGKLQIRGPVVTPGYLNNPEANRESFVGNGWFNSGDLGFIWKGRLYLTGREKEMIVVNGANIYCYDLEKVVSDIPGVSNGLVAAVGVATQSGRNDDELALFYVSDKKDMQQDNESKTHIPQERAVAKKIKAALLEAFGVVPSFIFTVCNDDFHRTTSGKIQRSQFKKLFQEGEFEQSKGNISYLEGKTSDYLPHVFGLKWVGADSALGVITDQNETCRFHWPIDPSCDLVSKADEVDLVNVIETSGDHTKLIIDFGEIKGVDSLTWFNFSQRLALLKRALQVDPKQLSLLLVLRSSSKSAYYLARPLIETLRQETGNRLISAVVANQSSAWNPSGFPTKPGIVWLDEHFRVLELVFVSQYQSPVERMKARCAVKRGGTYLITGGLGDLGLLLCRKLVSQYQATVILTGRRELESDQSANLRFIKIVSEFDSADIRYMCFDPDGSKSLSQMLEHADQGQGKPILNGVFHLAGILEQQTLDQISKDKWSRTVSAKVSYTDLLNSYLEQQSQASIFVQFSSLNSFWGGQGVAAYSFANAYQATLDLNSDSTNDSDRVAHWCIHWGLWQGVGMSKAFSSQDIALAKNKGFSTLDPNRDLAVLDQILSHAPDNYYVGMDPYHSSIKRHVDWYTNSFPQTEIHLPISESNLSEATIKTLVNDSIHHKISRVKQESLAVVFHDKCIPRDRDGNPDILALERSVHESTSIEVNPSGLIEMQIADIWSEVLNTQVTDVNRSFFEYGGHSINATQIIVKLNQKFKDNQDYKPLAVAQLFQAPTVSGLAKLISHDEEHSDFLSLKSCVDIHSDLAIVSLVKSASNANCQQSIVLLPTASGMPTVYSEFVARWQGDADLYVIQLPSYEFARTTGQDMHALGKLVASALIASDIDIGKTTLLGWSFGGVLGHAACRELSALDILPSRLLMLDSGIGSGLHEITFDSDFQLLMFASEFGVSPQEIPSFTQGKTLIDRLNWLSKTLNERSISINANELEKWWNIYRTRLHHLLEHQTDNDTDAFSTCLYVALNHSHGRSDLGWGQKFSSFEVRQVDADHQGIVGSQLTVDAIEELFKEGGSRG
ncbi:MAG: AMP-binding protein [Pseudomonadales bacterium]|nr:AMP-binding protein [Pseudomonadales bacterium]